MGAAILLLIVVALAGEDNFEFGTGLLFWLINLLTATVTLFCLSWIDQIKPKTDPAALIFSVICGLNVLSNILFSHPHYASLCLLSL
jgi:hypothetical protein